MLLRAPVRGPATPMHLLGLSGNRAPSPGGAPPAPEVRQERVLHAAMPSGLRAPHLGALRSASRLPCEWPRVAAASKPTSEKPTIPCQAFDTSHGKPSSGHFSGERGETTPGAPLTGEISERGRVSPGCSRTGGTSSDRRHMAGDEILNILVLRLLADLILPLQTKSLKNSFLPRGGQLQRAHFRPQKCERHSSTPMKERKKAFSALSWSHLGFRPSPIAPKTGHFLETLDQKISPRQRTERGQLAKLPPPLGSVSF